MLRPGENTKGPCSLPLILNGYIQANLSLEQSTPPLRNNNTKSWKGGRKSLDSEPLGGCDNKSQVTCQLAEPVSTFRKTETYMLLVF